MANAEKHLRYDEEEEIDSAYKENLEEAINSAEDQLDNIDSKSDEIDFKEKEKERSAKEEVQTIHFEEETKGEWRCNYCGLKGTKDRLEKHVEVCATRWLTAVGQEGPEKRKRKPARRR